MDTLYNLLGALPNDDAEGLRTAFRRAVKGAHPDINPGDPDAGLKFRQIVRAHEILADGDQRAAYDHLLQLAQLEQKQVSRHALAGTIHKLASGVMALSALSAAAIGGYLVYMHLSASPMAPADQNNVAASEAVAVTASIATEQAEASTPPATPETTETTNSLAETIVPAGAQRSSEAAAEPANVGPPLDITPNDARFYREQGIVAYRNGDLTGAVTGFDQAIQSDPKFAAAYIDRSIVLYRLRKFGRAFADLAQAKRLERENRVAVLASRKPHAPQPSAGVRARPVSSRRAAEMNPSHQQTQAPIGRPLPARNFIMETPPHSGG